MAPLAWAVFTDIVLAGYPAFIIWNLQMSKSLKWIICSLLSLGILSAACGIAKIISWTHLYEPGTLILKYRRCGTEIMLTCSLGQYPIASMLHITEMWVVSIAASAAPLWPLVKQLTGMK